MDRIDHLEHLDKHLVDELAQVAREAVRDELRDQTRKQRRTAALYAMSGAVALYAGAALALTLGLALAEGLPGWAAALISAAVLGALAYALRNMARPGPSRTHPRPAASARRATRRSRRPWAGWARPPFRPSPRWRPADPRRTWPRPSRRARTTTIPRARTTGRDAPGNRAERAADLAGSAARSPSRYNGLNGPSAEAAPSCGRSRSSRIRAWGSTSGNERVGVCPGYPAGSGETGARGSGVAAERDVWGL